MEEMQIYTIQDMMQACGCKTPEEFEEFLKLCRDMDEMDAMTDEIRADLATLDALLKDEETAQRTQELVSTPEVAGFLEGTEQLLQLGETFRKLVQREPDAKAELKANIEALPDALQKIELLTDEPAEMAETSKELTDSLQELNAALDASAQPSPMDKLAEEILASGDPGAFITDTIAMMKDMVDMLCLAQELKVYLDEEPVNQAEQEANRKEIAASMQELITQLREDSELRECIGVDTADAGVRELTAALQRLDIHTDPECS